ncbi:MAG: hypothetical protein RJA36_40 [Pseudomonadota bacterium]|jgi:hypothetical protein
MSTTDRHTALAWADSIEAERLACQRGATWAQVDAAIRAHLTHDAGCLADIGTESLCEQALLPTRPAELDAPVQTPARDDDPQLELAAPAWLALAAAAVVAVVAAASALLPWGFALPLP